MAYRIEARISKEEMESNLRKRVTDLQNEIGMEDHGWVMASEVAEARAKIVKEKVGDWRAKFQEAYKLSYEIQQWEKI